MTNPFSILTELLTYVYSLLCLPITIYQYEFRLFDLLVAILGFSLAFFVVGKMLGGGD